MGEIDHTGPVADLSGLRILGFCDYFTEIQGGGAEIVASEVYQYLQSRGAQVMVISVVPGAATRKTVIHGIPTTIVKGRDLSRITGSQVSLSRRIKPTGRDAVSYFQPDVLHASSIHFLGTVTAARIARSVGLPLVTTAHVGSIRALPRLTRAATTVYEQTIGRFVLRASNGVIAVSKSVADHISARGVPRSEITIVPNGVDHDRFQPRKSPKGRKNILFVGRLTKNKGALEALRAFARLGEPSATLTFVGDGPLRERLTKEISRLGVDQVVSILGRVADVAKVFATSDILIRPSLTEGQSLALLEAMATGICVVASDIPANAELVEHEVTGLLAPPRDVENMTNKLERVLRDEPLRARLGAAGYQRSLAFSWERCGAGTGAVLAAASAVSRTGT